MKWIKSNLCVIKSERTNPSLVVLKYYYIPSNWDKINELKNYAENCQLKWNLSTISNGCINFQLFWLKKRKSNKLLLYTLYFFQRDYYILLQFENEPLNKLHYFVMYDVYGIPHWRLISKVFLFFLFLKLNFFLS